MFITNVLGLTFWEEPKLCRRTYYHGVAKQESPCEAYDNKMRPWSLIINSLCWNSRISSQTLSILYIFIILISHILGNGVDCCEIGFDCILIPRSFEFNVNICLNFVGGKLPICTHVISTSHVILFAKNATIFFVQ